MLKILKIISISSMIFIMGCGTSSKVNTNTSNLPPSDTKKIEINQNEITELPKTADKPTSTPSKIEAMFKSCPPKDLDMASAKILSNGYIKDKNHVYEAAMLDCEFYILSDADPSTFVILSEGFAKDKNSIFNGNGKIEGADVATFKVVNIQNIPEGHCGRDKNRYYSSGGPLLEDFEGNVIDDRCQKVKE